MNRPAIDPALGLDLVAEQTLSRSNSSVSIVIPAHNEAETIAQVVKDCADAIIYLGVPGDVWVSASGCTDETADIASTEGAHVVQAPAGKGAAMRAGIEASSGDIVCLIDGDMKYFGKVPLAALLVEPILKGLADATIADLYWRPLYPQMWLYAFFAPLAGQLYPEMLSKVGLTPWSGQRAARRHLWPDVMPDDFTSDLAILLHWNDIGASVHPIVSDDWMNPQRPKPDLMAKELDLILTHAVASNRVSERDRKIFENWYDVAHALMSKYRPSGDDVQAFERSILKESREALYGALRG